MVIGFTWDRQKETPTLVVRMIMDLFNAKPVNIVSEKEVVTFLNVLLNKNNDTPMNHTEQKSPCLIWNMFHQIK